MASDVRRDVFTKIRIMKYAFGQINSKREKWRKVSYLVAHKGAATVYAEHLHYFYEENWEISHRKRWRSFDALKYVIHSFLSKLYLSREHFLLGRVHCTQCINFPLRLCFSCINVWGGPIETIYLYKGRSCEVWALWYVRSRWLSCGVSRGCSKIIVSGTLSGTTKNLQWSGI